MDQRCFILWGVLWLLLSCPHPVRAEPPDTNTAPPFSISVKPATGSLAPGAPGRLLVTYIASGGGNMTAISPSGTFLLPSGVPIDTHRKSVAMSIVNGSGAVAEAVTIPVKVATRALEQGYNQIVYRRFFNKAVQADVTIRIVPGPDGPLKITRLEMNFRNTRTRQISKKPTVPLHSDEIVAAADIHYTGSGMMQAQWKVDNQVLGHVTRFLKTGTDHISIESPAIPQLPACATGKHQVMLEIIDPKPGFKAPVATYIVPVPAPEMALKDGEIQIGWFIIRLSELIDNDPMNFSGSGTIALPFLNGKKLNVTFQNLRLDHSMVTYGDVLVNLQGMGFPPLRLGPSELTLNTINFRPDGAGCTGSLVLVLPFANPNVAGNKLTFDPAPLSIHPDNGFTGQLPLSQDISLKLSDAFGRGGVTFTRGSVITLTDNKFSAGLTGWITLPDTFSESPDTADIRFTGFNVQSDGGLYGNVSLSPLELAGTNLSLKGVCVLDFTTTASPEKLAEDPDWMGVYVTDGFLDAALFNDHVEIKARDLYIHNGVNGFLSSQPDKTISAGSAENRFLYRISNIEMRFQHFTGSTGTLSGKTTGRMTIPHVNLTADTEQIISVSGIEPVMTLKAAVPLTFADTVFLNVREKSAITFKDGVFTARLMSDVTALGDLGRGLTPGSVATLVLDSEGNIAMEEPDGHLNTWAGTRNQQTRLYGMFSLSLDQLGFGTRNNQLFFGVRGNLCLMEGFDSDPDAEICISIPTGNIFADNIHVGFSEPDAFRFSGRVNLMDNAPMGKGFEGEMDLSVADMFSVPTRLVAGHTGEFPYFYIDGTVRIPDPGILLIPYPISLYGFEGGACFNLTPGKIHAAQKQYEPAPGTLGLNALVTMGTTFDNGYTFNGDLDLNITVNGTGPDRTIDRTLRGDAWIQCSQPEDFRRIYADAAFSCHPGSACAFTSRMGVENFTITAPEEPLLTISGEADMKLLEENQWSVQMGTRQHPVSMQVLPSHVNSPARGYLTIDGSGPAAGLNIENIEMDTGRQSDFMFYSRLRGHLNSGFTVEFNPDIVDAEFPAVMELAAGLYNGEAGRQDIFRAFADFYCDIQAPDPTRIRITGDLSYPILGGSVSGMWPVMFTWGDSQPEMYDPSAAWPCVLHVDPEHGAEGACVATPIAVTLTQPEGPHNRMTFEDDSGRMYTAGIYVDKVVVNTSAVNLSNPLPGHIEWNDARTRLTFHPDAYLGQNTTYYVHVEAHAQGDPRIIPGGKWMDHFTAGFTTGAFPGDLKPLIQEAYPFNGQKFCYTRYPIRINFKKPMDILNYKQLKGRLFKTDGTEIPGTHQVTPDLDGVKFTPAVPLKPETAYVYKLMLEPPGEQRGPADRNRQDLISAISNVLLTLTFETGGYATFKQMMDASATAVQVEPVFFPSHEVITREGVKPAILRCTFDTVEPVCWDDIRIEAEPANSAPTACDWLTPRYCDHDPSCSDQERTVNRCLTRSAEEQLVYTGDASGRHGSARHTFDLFIRLMDYHVMPTSGDCRCSIDVWNEKIGTPAFAVSMMDHVIGSTLYQALLDRSKITFRHRMSPAVPYIITIDLPEPAGRGSEQDTGAETGFNIKTATRGIGF